jgi:DNA-binding response OmpR family regulator
MATILVVDGEEHSREQLQSMLSDQGHEVLVATNGVEGLELFQQRKPRFTLLDFHLSGLDGLQVLAQIRKTDQRAAVIMLDRGVSGALRLQAWKLGAMDFTKKNLPLKSLINAVGRAMSRSPRATDMSQVASGAVALAETAPARPGSESILIVDDSPAICDVVSQYFTNVGYRVLTAADGAAALALAEHVDFKLIIIDIYMPVMNGLALARELRARKYAGAILALTGSLEEDMLQAMLDIGAFDVIGKPVSMERLELAVHLGCLLAA